MPSHRKSQTVMVIDTRALRRSGISALLAPWAERHELEINALSPEQALELFEADNGCQMIVLNVGGQSITEREIQQRLKVIRALSPNAPIVAMSDREDSAEVMAALSAGLQGFLPTSIAQELALEAFSFILKGGSFFPPSAIRNASPAPPQEPEPSPTGRGGNGERGRSGGGHRAATDDIDDDVRGPVMTSRQQEVLRLLKDGHPNKVIARLLGMTEGTVKVHVRQIMRKLGASNRTQAALCAMHCDTISEDPLPLPDDDHDPPVVRDIPRVYAAE